MIRDTQAQDQIVTPASSAFWRKWKFPFWVGLFVITGSLSAYSWQQNSLSVDASQLLVATVKRGTLERDISVTGRVIAANAPQVYSTQAGSLTLLVKPGEQVSKGQLIAKVDNKQLTNALAQQKATLLSEQLVYERAKLDVKRQQVATQQAIDLAKVSLTASKREAKRAKTSFEKQVISELDFAKAQDELAKAELVYRHQSQAQQLADETLAFELKTKAKLLEQQQLKVNALEQQVTELAIKAPISGIVGNYLVAEKAQVSAAQPLLTVVDLSQFAAELLVPESYIDELGLGLEVQTTVAGQKINGSVTAISPEVKQRQVTVTVVLAQQDTSFLKQNQRLTARIVLEQKTDVLMLPKGAFLQDSAGRYGYRIEGNKAIKQAISTGATSLNHIEISTGAHAGEQWVISSIADFKEQPQVLLN